MADTDESQWSQLPRDILAMISKRLNTRVDSLRLRSVCHSWRSSVPPFRNAAPPLPRSLPFPIVPNPSLSPKLRGRFSLTQSTVYLLQPPTTTHDENALKPNPPKNSWLLRVEGGHDGGKFRPLNPLSRILTEHVPQAFPKSLNLLNFRISEIAKAYSLDFVDFSKTIRRAFGDLKSTHVNKVVVSSSPWTSNGADDYVVLAIQAGKLGFYKFGDEKWSPIDDPKQSHYDDIVYHRGQFYAVDFKGRVVVIGSDLKAKDVALPVPGFGGGQFKYLVKSCGDLFLVEKYMESETQLSYNDFLDDYIFEEVNPDMPVHFKVFKLNEDEKKWEWIQSLDDQVFFVGDDCSYSVSARYFVGLKGNCIYFSEDMFDGENEADDNLGEYCPDTGVYCLEDGSCGPLASFPDYSQMFWTSPAWLKPNQPASKK